MNRDEDRDLAGEATVRDAYLQRLRADISVEEANAEFDQRSVYDLSDADYEVCDYAWREQYRSYNS